MPVQARDPASQYQLGEEVVYLPEGVITKVQSYVWTAPNDGTASLISAYTLTCGITAKADAIAAKGGRSKEPVMVKPHGATGATGATGPKA
jgi:hypothetical protein